MHVRFLLGPAGSGKTFRCLTEIRQALAGSQEGPPLVLVAPKQTTYQLERRFLAHFSLPGYSRLHILSFERLARFVFERLGRSSPEMLDEEGRLMVLRALLARKRDDLKLYRASARLTGFAQQLSLVLRDLQRNELTPESLLELAEQVRNVESLSYKLHDLATLLRDYSQWLDSHRLKDADCLLTAAREALAPEDAPAPQPVALGGLWVDGFAEFAPQELDLLAALAPACPTATITFCLDQIPSGKSSWLSAWSAVRRSFEECQKKFAAVPGAEAVTEIVQRQEEAGRFLNSPALSFLEAHWSEPQAWTRPVTPALRQVACANPEAEVTMAAREILRHARAGGRYRDITVLVRNLESYHEPMQRVFSRYEIPFFLDRRESVSHHPMAELTRNALRTVASQWMRDDWFAALKTGLAPAEENEIDRLENEALARGWKGSIWLKPITLAKEPDLNGWLADIHHRIMPPFQKLALALGVHQNRPTGPELAQALRGFWQQLNVEEQLRQWAEADIDPAKFHTPGSVHTTVWTQMNTWLANVELAFATESLPLREWLPVLDAGLANLSVGVIPPALDQVLIGAIDRSRNPDIKLAILLGLNETVFPAPPETTVLLTDADRLELERRNVQVGATARHQLSRERYHAYIACTRARERLVLSSALHDANGSPLNPSPFLAHLQQIFPKLTTEVLPPTQDWRDSQHATELIAPLLTAFSPQAQAGAAGGNGSVDATRIPDDSAAPPLPLFARLLDQLRHFHTPAQDESLSPALAARLYGPVLRTSVSRLENFAACPFKFFVHSGLRAEERKKFELDVREQGSFQHDVLALFHEQLRREGKRWRDITPQEARERVGHIARTLVVSYREGLLDASEQTRFMARVMTESLQDFLETLVGWMREQYQFDPAEVELPFGQVESCPAWKVDAGDGAILELYGRIDRVDLYRRPGSDAALCVVLDYKSSQKQLDPLLLANGLQLQLLTYLNVMRQWPDPRQRFGAERLIPAGVFYVNLHGKYEREANRQDALEDASQARKRAYRHSGRFDSGVLRLLDTRAEAKEGDQFNYRMTKSGELHKGSSEPLPADQFEALLDTVEANIKRMGREIFGGQTKVSPYRKGAVTACDYCDYRAICRVDPWTHSFRVLRSQETAP